MCDGMEDSRRIGDPPMSEVAIRLVQKSGLSARGTSAAFPEYHWMFSVQIFSGRLPEPRP